MNTGQALIAGAAVRVAARLLDALSRLILLPFIVSALGDRHYGAWVLIGTVIGYYGLLDLGLSSAVSRFVSRELGRGNKEESDCYIVTSLCVLCVGGFLAGVATVIVALFCGTVLTDPDEIRVFRSAIMIAGLTFAVSFPSRAFGGVLTAHLQFALATSIEIFFSLLRMGVTVLVLVMDGKIVGLVLGNSLVSLAQTLTMVGLAVRVHRGIHLRRSLVSRRHLAQLFGYGFFTFIAQMTDLLRFRVAPVLITAVLGLAAVTPYAIAMTLRRTAGSFCIAILSMLMPVFSRQEGAGDEQGLKRTYFFGYKIACYVGLFLVGMVGIVGNEFVFCWMGSGWELSVTLLYLGLIDSAVAVIQIPTVNLLYGLSKNRFYALSNGIHGVLTVGMSLALITRYGLIGVVAGEVLASIMIKTLLQPWWGCKVFSMGLMTFHTRYTLPNIVKVAAFLGPLFLVSRNMLRPTFFSVFAFGTLGCAAFSIYIFFVGFTQDERALFIRAAKVVPWRRRKGQREADVQGTKSADARLG